MPKTKAASKRAASRVTPMQSLRATPAVDLAAASTLAKASPVNPSKSMNNASPATTTVGSVTPPPSDSLNVIFRLTNRWRCTNSLCLNYAYCCWYPDINAVYNHHPLYPDAARAWADMISRGYTTMEEPPSPCLSALQDAKERYNSFPKKRQLEISPISVPAAPMNTDAGGGTSMKVAPPPRQDPPHATLHETDVMPEVEHSTRPLPHEPVRSPSEAPLVILFEDSWMGFSDWLSYTAESSDETLSHYEHYCLDLAAKGMYFDVVLLFGEIDWTENNGFAKEHMYEFQELMMDFQDYQELWGSEDSWAEESDGT